MSLPDFQRQPLIYYRHNHLAENRQAAAGGGFTHFLNPIGSGGQGGAPPGTPQQRPGGGFGGSPYQGTPKALARDAARGQIYAQ